MVVIHSRPKRKLTGGRYKSSKTKRVYMIGSKPTMTHVGKSHLKTTRTKGGDSKTRLLSADKVNLFDPKSGKHMQDSIKTVADNPANRHFTRHNIITKGAIVMTSKGKAKVTNRPGQEGYVNATLV